MLTSYTEALVCVIESQYTAKQLPGYAGTDLNLVVITCGVAQTCCFRCNRPALHALWTNRRSLPRLMVVKHAQGFARLHGAAQKPNLVPAAARCRAGPWPEQRSGR